jgi:hypothetical protein
MIHPAGGRRIDPGPAARRLVALASPGAAARQLQRLVGRLARLLPGSQATYRCFLVKRVPTVAEQEALQIARLWDPATHRVEHVRSGENATWATELDGRRSILRLTSEEHRTRDQIEAELDFIEYLAAAGLSVARPLSKRQWGTRRRVAAVRARRRAQLGSDVRASRRTPL